MLGRRLIFCFSLVLAITLHVLLFMAAPEIVLLRHNTVAARFTAPIQIRMLEETERTAADTVTVTSLATRPGSVRDLLDLESPYRPDSFEALAPAPIPELSERLKNAIGARDYELTPDAAENRQLDARILEISAENARAELQITRRLVRPSNERLLEDGALPSMRMADADTYAEHLSFDLPTVSLLAEPFAELESMAREGDGRIGGTVTVVPEASPSQGGALEAEQRLAGRSAAASQIALREASTSEILDGLVVFELTTYEAAEERLGYFRVRILPDRAGALKPLPKEVLFVIDASNSISAQKMRHTVRGVIAALALLRPEDRFNVVAFRDSATYFRAQSVSATAEEIQAAQVFLNSLESRGQTDIYQALLPLLSQGPEPGYPRMIFVLSDGRPTRGVTDGRTIINGLTADNGLRNTILSFGGGNTVNQPMLDLLAYRNKGAASYSPDIPSMDNQFSTFFGTLNDPLLVSLSADFSGLDQDEVYPQVLPDFFGGRPIEIYGRYNPEIDAPFALRLLGYGGATQWEVAFRADLSSAASGGPEIARHWAFQKAYHLIGEISRLGEEPALIDAVRTLSRQYNLRTSYDE